MSSCEVIVPSAPVPLVSVVIPTRARPEVLQRAVRSSLGQTLELVEVIVVIDGDDPKTIVALELLQHDMRLRIVALPQSVGAAEARNVGVRAARSEWIAFLDDDDEWLPRKLEVQLACALTAQAPLPVVCSAYLGRSSSGDELLGRRARSPGELISEYMFCRHGFSYGENAIATSVLFVPRALMLSVPFDPGLKRHQDWDWALRAFDTPGTALYHVAEPLSLYTMPDGSGSMSGHNDWQYSLNWCIERKRFFTPRAMSFFIATECISRAGQANAGFGKIMTLLRDYWREGQPTWRSAALAASYLILSKRLRRFLLTFRP